MDTENAISPSPEPHNEGPKEQLPFYTVSEKKFLIMFLGTFGVYGIYWFYRHWTAYKESQKNDIWPVARGIFSIFFTHSLFSLFEHKYEIKNGERPRTIKHLATIYVIASIIGNIGGNVAEAGYLMPIAPFSLLIALFVTAYCLHQAQSLVNYAGDDVTGSSNNTLSFANHLWLMFGFVIWVLNILGIHFMLNGGA